jgi:hypothetical protein
MADQSIFGNENNTATQPNTQQTDSTQSNAQANTELATLLSSIKNERGEQKYATVEAALDGLRNAQEFIPNLRIQLTEREQEIERLRVQAERAAELERTITELTANRQQEQNTSAPVLDESLVADLVNRTLTQREKQALAQANVATVVSTLQSVFGTDAESKFYGKAQELGLSKEEANALAAKSPKAVLTMLGVTQAATNKQNQSNPTSGTVNTEAFTPNNETFVGRNSKQVIVGATSQDIKESFDRAKKMTEELHAKGMSVYDFTDPKTYFKHFS